MSASPCFIGVSPDAARGLMGLGNEGEGSGFYTLKEGGESATAFAPFPRLSLVCRRPGNRAIGTREGGKCGHRKKIEHMQETSATFLLLFFDSCSNTLHILYCHVRSSYL